MVADPLKQNKNLYKKPGRQNFQHDSGAKTCRNLFPTCAIFIGRKQLESNSHLSQRIAFPYSLMYTEALCQSFRSWKSIMWSIQLNLLGMQRSSEPVNTRLYSLHSHVVLHPLTFPWALIKCSSFARNVLQLNRRVMGFVSLQNTSFRLLPVPDQSRSFLVLQVQKVFG